MNSIQISERSPQDYAIPMATPDGRPLDSIGSLTTARFSIGQASDFKIPAPTRTRLGADPQPWLTFDRKLMHARVEAKMKKPGEKAGRYYTYCPQFLDDDDHEFEIVARTHELDIGRITGPSIQTKSMPQAGPLDITIHAAFEEAWRDKSTRRNHHDKKPVTESAVAVERLMFVEDKGAFTFKTLDLHRDDYRWVKPATHDRPARTFLGAAWKITASITVIDPQKFALLAINGIGAEKHFGLGLISF